MREVGGWRRNWRWGNSGMIGRREADGRAFGWGGLGVRIEMCQFTGEGDWAMRGRRGGFGGGELGGMIGGIWQVDSGEAGEVRGEIGRI